MYLIGFLLLVVFFSVTNLFFGKRISANAWWGETHCDIVEAALLQLNSSGSNEAVSYFSKGKAELLAGAVAPDKAGDVDFSLTGGTHYCMLPKKSTAETLIYCKRAGIGPFSPFMKTACTIAEENYTMALVYAVQHKNDNDEIYYKFAMELLGRAIHAISDCGAIPHCTGMRMLGKKSFHFVYERAARHIGKIGFGNSDIKRKFAGYCGGDFVRRLANYLSVETRRGYREAGREKALERDFIIQNLYRVYDAAAFLMYRFFEELGEYSSVGQILTGRKAFFDDNETFIVKSVRRKAKVGFAKLSFKLSKEFPCFADGFRIARADDKMFYITDGESGFKRILYVKKGELVQGVFKPSKKSSFVTFQSVGD